MFYLYIIYTYSVFHSENVADSCHDTIWFECWVCLSDGQIGLRARRSRTRRRVYLLESSLLFRICKSRRNVKSRRESAGHSILNFHNKTGAFQCGPFVFTAKGRALTSLFAHSNPTHPTSSYFLHLAGAHTHNAFVYLRVHLRIRAFGTAKGECRVPIYYSKNKVQRLPDVEMLR